MTTPSPGVPGETDPAAPIRVALVDDQQLVRGGFKMLINSQPDLTVVAEAVVGVERTSNCLSTYIKSGMTDSSSLFLHIRR